jgi:hypothetical protein
MLSRSNIDVARLFDGNGRDDFAFLLGQAAAILKIFSSQIFGASLHGTRQARDVH